MNGVSKSFHLPPLYSVLGPMPELTRAVALVHHLVKLNFLSQPHCHGQHLGNITTANGIEAIWKPVHVLMIFLTYRDIKWKRQSTSLLFLCYLGSILQLSWAYFHICIKRILDYIIAYDPANTNISMILSFIDDKMGVQRRLSVSVDITHPSPICPPNMHISSTAGIKIFPESGT